jgi:hypothetical protein
VKETKQKQFRSMIKKITERATLQGSSLLLIELNIDSHVAIKFNKIQDTPTHGICNRIENTRIQFLIDLVANRTKPHIPNPSFNTLPYFSGSFIQMTSGGACDACGAACLTPVAVLLPGPMATIGGTVLA